MNTENALKAIGEAVRAALGASETPVQEPELFSVRDVMLKLRISRPTVYRLVERGAFNFVHLGRAVRVRRSDVERIASDGFSTAAGGKE